MTHFRSIKDGSADARMLKVPMNSSFIQGQATIPADLFAGRRLKVGVLTNPYSGGNKNGGTAVRQILSQWPDILHLEPETPHHISTALSDFSRAGTELIIINGGDGTIQQTLTALGSKNLFDKPPLLALLLAGTTSMLPRDVGVTGSPSSALQQILTWAQATNNKMTVSTRPILKVERNSEPPLLGMFFGAGAICEGIKAFHSRDNPMGWRGQVMPALTMIRFLTAIFRKNHDRLPPLVNKAVLDGRQADTRTDLLVLVSTLKRLFLGMRPYWGEEEAPLRYTAVSSEPKYLLRVLSSLFSNRKNRYATLANGYSSHNVQRIELEMMGDFTLDGELYRVTEGSLVIQSAGKAMFLCSN
jgi:diacylglycerol kinase (ATP)